MPKQKPGKSKQDYGTPKGFLEAVKQKLHIEDFTIDLAASAENSVTNFYIGEEQNSLVQDWAGYTGWCWLNPPFADIEPWAKKAYVESTKGAHIAMLVPLSIAQWWVYWVEQMAYVHLLNGRLTFVGETKPYPKDCALLLYGPEGYHGYEVWSWRN